LADIYLLANYGDFLARKYFGACRKLIRARGDFSSGVVRPLPQTVNEIIENEIRNFVFFWPNWI